MNTLLEKKKKKVKSTSKNKYDRYQESIVEPAKRLMSLIKQQKKKIISRSQDA